MELTNSGGNNPVNFKKANQHQLGEITNRINKVIEKIYQQELLQKRTMSLMQQVSMLLKSLVQNRLQGNRARCRRQRRIEGDIKRIRKDINMLERIKRGELRKKGRMEQSLSS